MALTKWARSYHSTCRLLGRYLTKWSNFDKRYQGSDRNVVNLAK